VVSARSRVVRVDVRKSRRKPMHCTAWAYSTDRSVLHLCMVSDASEEGGCLTIATPNDTPDEFTLLLKRDGSIYRRCRVIWRSRRQMGVQFFSSR